MRGLWINCYEALPTCWSLSYPPLNKQLLIDIKVVSIAPFLRNFVEFFYTGDVPLLRAPNNDLQIKALSEFHAFGTVIAV